MIHIFFIFLSALTLQVTECTSGTGSSHKIIQVVNNPMNSSLFAAQTAVNQHMNGSCNNTGSANCSESEGNSEESGIHYEVFQIIINNNNPTAQDGSIISDPQDGIFGYSNVKGTDDGSRGRSVSGSAGGSERDAEGGSNSGGNLGRELRPLPDGGYIGGREKSREVERGTYESERYTSTDDQSVKHSDGEYESIRHSDEEFRDGGYRDGGNRGGADRSREVERGTYESERYTNTDDLSVKHADGEYESKRHSDEEVREGHYGDGEYRDGEINNGEDDRRRYIRIGGRAFYGLRHQSEETRNDRNRGGYYRDGGDRNREEEKGAYTNTEDQRRYIGREYYIEARDGRNRDEDYRDGGDRDRKDEGGTHRRTEQGKIVRYTSTGDQNGRHTDREYVDEWHRSVGFGDGRDGRNRGQSFGSHQAGTVDSVSDNSGHDPNAFTGQHQSFVKGLLGGLKLG